MYGARERRPGRGARGRPRPIALGVLAGLAVAAGPGCAGPGLASRYQALDREWHREAERAAPADPADPFPGAPVLDRAALVREVLRRNPTLQASRYAWRAALARYPQETSLDDPMLGVGAAPRSFGSDAVDDAVKVDLSQKLPFPGKLSLRGEVALGEAEAAGRDFEAVRLRLATMASLLFDDSYLLARSVAINAEHIALLDEFLRIATARYEAGEASQQDPLQAEVERAMLARRDVALRTAQRVTAEQINVLLHRRPDLPLPPPPAELAPTAPEAIDTGSRMESALAERPELRAAEARVRSRQAAVDLARREFLPDVTLVGSYNGIMQQSQLQPFVGVVFNVPLRIERRRAAVDEARARLERARLEHARVEDEVRFSVQSAADRLGEARDVLGLYRDRLLPAARDQVAAARAGFETGRNSFLALIDAERGLRNVELGYEEALADMSRRVAELESATGRLPGLPPEETP
jgi:outer membrane protein, heavy metal efflux system